MTPLSLPSDYLGAVKSPSWFIPELPITALHGADTLAMHEEKGP